MNTETEDRRFAVLFVDDEEKARKYFSRAFGEEFEILTAESVTEARQILERRGHRIALVMTDQRMPEQNGVELLRTVRDGQPQIVRLLTTAYSDLGDAIDAVNRGEVFRYITKPWNIDALRAELRQAMGFFHLRRERDLLVREKLNVWQRMVQVNRVRDLIVMAGSFAHLRNAVPAIAAYLRQDVVNGRLGQLAPMDQRQLDLWSLVQREVDRMLGVARDVLECTYLPGVAEPFPDRLQMGELLLSAAVEAGSQELRTPLIDIAADVPAIRGKAALLGRLVDGLARQVAGSDGKVEVTAQACDDPSPDSVRLVFAGTGRRSATDTLDTTDQLDLMCAFLIAYHHGGHVELQRVEPSGERVIVCLPTDPATTRAPELDAHWLEDILALFEPSD